MQKTILIVGGSSGVGLELAKHYVAEGHRVCITGRRDPHLPGAVFFSLPIGASADEMLSGIDSLITVFPGVQTLVYSMGFLQRGLIDALDSQALLTMTHVGLVAPMALASRLKPLAPTPLKLMLVTSSSQYTPRAQEPAYAATKAGLGMLGASLVRDSGIGKVLVAAPSGIRTPFWSGTDEDTSTMLDPGWVAKQIVQLSSGAFKYRYAKLLRNPARVEVVETLDNSFAPIT
ncbi:SDR family NAD(P)-dependent oxidoreductase [Sinirhodobacter populi]|uniref:SDR family NAD(P)-dependent oxidoreductase n=1 Tax=Paenirhodobacter populi TaxID=2306993 RepID=A0A443K382_9RHOB|nr:SDR family NAD(P)-dependent oxidoreductase [Sinirhodobacter populi]RWR27217.1 SDR family NAD(P)-dependent oxidoreductase [Sinirhodobacter populi]